MIAVRNVYRGLIAGALGLPLAFGAPSVALAGEYDKDGGGYHKSDEGHGNKDDGENGKKDGKGDRKKSDAGDGDKAVDASRPSSEQVQGQENTGGQEQETDQKNASSFSIYQFVFGGKGDPLQTVTPMVDQTNEGTTEQNQGFAQGQASEQGQDVSQGATLNKGSGTSEDTRTEETSEQGQGSGQGQTAEEGQATEKM
ncbi:hypothetical protein DFQ14_108178 [Halopolyspora algeriensis]|uniref:Uncharacterized protein n=1 Tax=Halopolyspora algeriensis TaxID=1500506 RepID=A0A368VN13_9ACTN|nr:hypothetical protein [Halopolyspora algeriensis]RCW42918.1 hypothetical protein DFQ14_108178 [Halopolyspora algeriensis]TQM56613.1 hypothetical protein FHU43_1421 [Halopolyspora algeriensis]